MSTISVLDLVVLDANITLRLFSHLILYISIGQCELGFLPWATKISTQIPLENVKT